MNSQISKFKVHHSVTVNDTDGTWIFGVDISGNLPPVTSKLAVASNSPRFTLIAVKPKAEFINVNFEVSGHNLFSVYNAYFTNQFQNTFVQRGRGVKSISRGDCEL